MLTAIALAYMLGLPQSPCSGPGCSGPSGPPGPSHAEAGGKVKIFHHGGGGVTCYAHGACPLGMFVPCGDDWAVNMRRGVASNPEPVTTPAGAPDADADADAAPAPGPGPAVSPAPDSVPEPTPQPDTR